MSLIAPSTRRLKWDRRFLRLAKHWAEECSKDPSTKVGAVIVNKYRRVIGMGYNGFPEGVQDTPERLNDRPTKYKLVVHAEANAILNAVSDTRRSTIYIWPLFSCHECAKLVIQAGIRRVVAPDDVNARWGESFETAKLLYREAGVIVDLIDWHEPKERKVGRHPALGMPYGHLASHVERTPAARKMFAPELDQDEED